MPPERELTFAEMIELTPPAELARLRALSPKERSVNWIKWCEHDSEDVVASKLLQFHGGDARAAEADAWAVYDVAAGGTWGNRSNQEGMDAGRTIVAHIVDGTEKPPVPRVVKARPSFM